MMVVRTQSLDMMVVHILVSDTHNLVLAMRPQHRDDGVQQMVRNHHERHDYHHLKGEEIGMAKYSHQFIDELLLKSNDPDSMIVFVIQKFYLFSILMVE